jgi:hypothetical protein
MSVLRVVAAPFAILYDLFEYHPRLASALTAVMLWHIMYLSLYRTQIIDKIEGFWPLFLIVGLGFVVLCGCRDLPFTAVMAARAVIFMVVLGFAILLLWEPLDLGEVSPTPQPRHLEGSLIDEPAERLDTHVFSWCYLVGFPLAVLMTLWAPWMGFLLEGIIQIVIAVLANLVTKWLFS